MSKNPPKIDQPDPNRKYTKSFHKTECKFHVRQINVWRLRPVITVILTGE